MEYGHDSLFCKDQAQLLYNDLVHECEFIYTNGLNVLGLIQEETEINRKKDSQTGHQKKIFGYWEDWRKANDPDGKNMEKPIYYKNDVAPFTHIAYAFLTLDPKPTTKPHPHHCRWDGKAIYENMTADDVIKVMTKSH